MKHLQQMAEGNVYSRNMLVEHHLRLVTDIVKHDMNTNRR